jgi:Family of unknown function (DUF6069)
MRTAPPLLDRTLAIARIDWTPAHRQPNPVLLLAGAVVAIIGALAADAILVEVGTHVFPATAGYEHFKFGDYAKLTIIGVVIGAAGWSVLTRISSSPRWLYGRLTILISLVLFLPDVWLLIHHQPPKAVVVLMSMHVAVAAVIYCAMVNIAPIRNVT